MTSTSWLAQCWLVRAVLPESFRTHARAMVPIFDMYHGRGRRGSSNSADYSLGAVYYHDPPPLPICLSHSAHHSPPLVKLCTSFACRADLVPSLNTSLASRFVPTRTDCLIDVDVDWHDPACLAAWQAMYRAERASNTDMFASAPQARGALAASFPAYLEMRPGLVPMQQLTHDLVHVRISQLLVLNPGPDSWFDLFLGEVMFESISIWQFGSLLFVHDAEQRLLAELKADSFWDVRPLEATMA